MNLLLSVFLFLVCTISAALFFVLSAEKRKKLFLALGIALSLAALFFLIYSALTFALVFRSDAPTEQTTYSGSTQTVDTRQEGTTLEPDPTKASTDDTQPTKTESKTTTTASLEPAYGDMTLLDSAIEEAATTIMQTRRDSLSSLSFSYKQELAYDQLSAADRGMYDEILEKVRALIPFSYTAAEHGYDEMDRALYICQLINQDHPELEIYFTMHDVVEGTYTTALEARYAMPGDPSMADADTEELRKELEFFEASAHRIVSGMPGELSTYDRYRYLAFVVSLMTEYDYSGVGGRQVGTAYGAFVGGLSICQGYARGFQYLCKAADLWCEFVTGLAGDNESHGWNMVKLDTGTYHVDVTWSDELGYLGSASWEAYFMLTEDEISADHEVTDGKIATGTQMPWR